jgi:hypothetical protein
MRISASSSTFIDCGVTTSADNGSTGISLETDNTGSGPYYNKFIGLKAQGPQNGLSTGDGITMTQRAGTIATTRYANANTFIGGRSAGYFRNWVICGSGNKFYGPTSENAPLYGTAFKWICPVASANGANIVSGPYIENASISFDVDPLTSAPMVDNIPYSSGVSTLLNDPSGRLTISGYDGIRGMRLAAAPVAGVARSGLFLGNTANNDPATLDWYEEVVFTPLVIGSISLSTGTTHTTQFGRATRIGNRVMVSGFVNWSASTETGNLLIDFNDIPWAHSAISNSNIVYSLRSSLITWTAGKQISGLGVAGAKRMQIEQLDPAGGAVAAVPMDAAGSVFFSGTFLI